MIVCSNCDTENADNANHCGNCGARLQKGGGQKTMFGFAAVSQEEMKQAAEEAKAARQAAEGEGGAASDAPAKPRLPTPGIPSPGGGGSSDTANSGSSLPSPGGLNIPRPGQANAGASTGGGSSPEQDRSAMAFGDTAPPGSGKLDAPASPPRVNLGAPETLDETAPSTPATQPEAGGTPLAPPTEPETGGWQDPPSSSPEPESGGWQDSPSSSDGSWGDQGAAASSTEDSWTDGGGVTATADDGWSEPSVGASSDAPPAGGLPQTSPGGQNLMSGGGDGGGFGGGSYSRGEVRNPVMVMVFAMFSCGLYGIYWFHAAMQDLNGGLGEERFNSGKEIALIFVTCGFWGYWLLWRMCEAIGEVQNRWGVEPQLDPPIMFLTNLVGLGIFFMQNGLNNAWENGQPPA